MGKTLHRWFFFLISLAVPCLMIASLAHAQNGCNSGGCCFNGRCYAGYHGPDPLGGGSSTPAFVYHPNLNVNRSPTAAEIRRDQQQQALEAAQQRYNAAVQIEKQAEAKNLADASASSQATARALQDFLQERNKLASMLRDDTSASVVTLRDDSDSTISLRNDASIPLPVSLSAKPSKWGREPPLPSSVGLSLSSTLPDSVAPEAATDYMGRALQFIRDDALKTANSAARKSALSGEMFAEAEMGPYGMTTVVMMNVATLPESIFHQILGVVTGAVPPEEGQHMDVQAVNHIYNFGSPVNSAVSSGVLETARDQVSGAIQSQAKETLASLTASFLPVKEDVQQQIAGQATHIADTALDAYKHIFTPAGADQDR